MARFRLMADHYFETQLQEPIHLTAGTEVDTATMAPWFKPSTLMTPLDEEAVAMLKQVAKQVPPVDPLLVRGSWSVPN
jgi:hypothetical protein